MTVNDLIRFLNDHAVPGEFKVCVEARGGIGARGKPIVKAVIGFDWDAGSVLLVPKNVLHTAPQVAPTVTQEDADRQAGNLIALYLPPSQRFDKDGNARPKAERFRAKIAEAIMKASSKEGAA